jgi:hypothetical protein
MPQVLRIDFYDKHHHHSPPPLSSPYSPFLSSLLSPFTSSPYFSSPLFFTIDERRGEQTREDRINAA